MLTLQKNKKCSKITQTIDIGLSAAFAAGSGFWPLQGCLKMKK
jgi:hypothetical protein